MTLEEIRSALIIGAIYALILVTPFALAAVVISLTWKR
jgi:hypothetical protein